MDGDSLLEEAEDPLLEELPCWMMTHQRLLPKDSWSDFVFDLLFQCPVLPTWDCLHFLQVYRGFKKRWHNKCPPAGLFNSHFGPRIGHYMQVVFNSNRSKEVSTNHSQTT